eukprot:2911889-Alexandrium_andersonii.AAC.1
MSASLVGSEMCIRDSPHRAAHGDGAAGARRRPATRAVERPLPGRRGSLRGGVRGGVRGPGPSARAQDKIPKGPVRALGVP